MSRLTVYRTPSLDPIETEVLRLIDGLREDLRHRVAQPRRWFGTLRRMTFARAVQGSNSIEGYNASLDDVAAAVEGEPTLDATLETQFALAGYRDAMTYVLQVAEDENAEIDAGMIKALHFMMLKHDLSKGPGRWRPGDIGVRNDANGKVVYEGPDAEKVGELVNSMLDALRRDNAPTLVRAAMAHLNLVMIHPFRDGDGRMARCLQTLVIARAGVLSPVFCSIEEYLGRNTQAYYDVLANVGRGSWNPGGDATQWVRFKLTAHLRQAQTLHRRIKESEQLWDDLERLIAEKKLPYRTINPLYDASMRYRVRNGMYRAVLAEAEEEISEQVATRDLKQLTEAGLLIPHGSARGRFYTASARLTGMRQSIIANRDTRDDSDPFSKS